MPKLKWTWPVARINLIMINTKISHLLLNSIMINHSIMTNHCCISRDIRMQDLLFEITMTKGWCLGFVMSKLLFNGWDSIKEYPLKRLKIEQIQCLFWRIIIKKIKNQLKLNFCVCQIVCSKSENHEPETRWTLNFCK